MYKSSIFKSTIILTLLITNTLAYKPLTFLSIGDWGGYNLGSYYKKNIIDVSNALINDYNKNNHSFIINTGDNFYYCGIQSLNDYNIQADYINLFNKVQLPWYSVLGNHDYGYNVSAQLKLHTLINQWIMPSRYYYIEAQPGLYIVALDTNPCISDYRGNDQSKWDPCHKPDYYCGNYTKDEPCRFHENILSQTCDYQFQWFQHILDNIIPNNAKIIVVGHHPVFEIDVMPFSELVNNDARIVLYINGHTHMFGTYEYNKTNKYITNGAGSMVQPSNIKYEKVKGNLDVINMEYNKKGNLNKKKKHKYDMYSWYERISGYARHLIYESHLRTDFIGINGEIIYQYNITF